MVLVGGTANIKTKHNHIQPTGLRSSVDTITLFLSGYWYIRRSGSLIAIFTTYRLNIGLRGQWVL